MTAARLVAGGVFAGNAARTAPKTQMTANATTQATATLLTFEYNEFGTVGASGAAVLPNENQMGLTPGDELVVTNLGANTLSVFPPVGGYINALAVNTALSVAAGKTAHFMRTLNGLKWIAILSA